MTPPDRLTFAKRRLDEILRVLELMAAGDTEKRLTISDAHDELDAIAHAVNVLVGELGWTAARMLEAQEERIAAAERGDASKGIFLRNMSHEIRTPIAAMVAFADLLLSADPHRPPRVDLLQRLQANGRAVLSLLDDLLDLAKLDADKIVLSPEPVAVIDLVRDVLASVEVERRAKRLEMRVDAAGNALGTIFTDRFRLRQILVNLVGNAVKFTEAGSVTVALRIVGDPHDEQWAVDVIDTGIGIASDRHACLFEPFEQADAEISRVYGGNGLGLALSRRLAQHMGGKLELLLSRPGKGSTFRLMLRSLPASAPGAEILARTADEIETGLAGLRCLLAEDHRDLHLALRGMLEKAGAIVTSAYDGRDAVDQILANEFDLVLMDLRMPQMDGLQATRLLRSRGCASHIIALTADPATFWHAAALEAGCDACLSKPFRIDQVVASIRSSARRVVANE